MITVGASVNRTEAVALIFSSGISARGQNGKIARGKDTELSWGWGAAAVPSSHRSGVG